MNTTREEKKMKRMMMLELMGMDDSWYENKDIRAAVFALGRETNKGEAREPRMSEPTTKQRHIIRLIQEGKTSRQASIEVGCSYEYASTIKRNYETGVYDHFVRPFQGKEVGKS
ncbi:MAG: hypothetical protein K8V42_06285 [Enterococcus aquimarinus]|uniref:Uncharacterized protein n=1 Tax=Enterococcus aquimarinus TaxID=328396 RepID=A0A9E3ZTF6_9ENTE|nr:hypothetical protein [Enterococcus aquimarinus]